MLTKKDAWFLKGYLCNKTGPSKRSTQHTRFCTPGKSANEKEIISEVVDVVTVVMNSIKNHEARLVTLEI